MRRNLTTKSVFSEFQARGMSRRQYDAKAIQVAQIVDEVTTAYQEHNAVGLGYNREVRHEPLLKCDGLR
jgi:hypothetical protein